METMLVEIREQQKQTWNRFSPGWRKWDEFTMHFLKPMGDAIISELKIEDGDNVLDVASGTGEPGITIASLTPTGKVTGVDISDGMLQVAKEHALSKAISNYETVVADVCELPFNDEEFDKISCRMGFMFFPDMQLAAHEMYRVLKSGGRMATCVWGLPDRNFWITNITGTINRKLQIAPPPPGAPGMFRCASPGVMRSILEKAGFVYIKEQEITGKVVYENFEQMWQMMNEVAAPVVSALSNADEKTTAEIKAEVQQLSKQFETTNGIELEYGSLVFSGLKE
jgi:ubiquinone/menaquinone biosynthesis C-methylase UbiE